MDTALVPINCFGYAECVGELGRFRLLLFIKLPDGLAGTLVRVAALEMATGTVFGELVPLPTMTRRTVAGDVPVDFVFALRTGEWRTMTGDERCCWITFGFDDIVAIARGLPAISCAF